jgi:hypothetical protein
MFEPMSMWRKDSVWPCLCRLGGRFRLYQRVLVYFLAVGGLHDDLDHVTNRNTSRLPQFRVDRYEEPAPALANVAVKPNTIKRTAHEPAMPAPRQSYWFTGPAFLWIKWDDYCSNSLVPLDQFRFKLCLVSHV